jgi:hypothetical protein
MVVMQKGSMEWFNSSSILSSQAVKMPPEAPLEFLLTKDRRLGGRKEAACKQITEGRKLSIAARTS